MAVLVRYVLEQLVAPLVRHVRVDVRHADPFGVQKALEEQIVLDGVELRDAERPRDDGSGGGASPGSHGDTSVLRRLDDAGDDQEVACEPHAVDDGEFIPEPLLVVVGYLPAQPLLQPGPGLLLEIGLEGLPLGQPEVGELVVPVVERQCDVAPLGYQDGVVEGVGQLRAEETVHFLGRAEIEVVRGEGHALLVVKGRLGLHAQEHLVPVPVLLR